MAIKLKIKKTLPTRTHVCSCGYTTDRDTNAAINILQLGLSRVGRTQTNNAWGDLSSSLVEAILPGYDGSLNHETTCLSLPPFLLPLSLSFFFLFLTASFSRCTSFPPLHCAHVVRSFASASPARIRSPDASWILICRSAHCIATTTSRFNCSVRATPGSTEKVCVVLPAIQRAVSVIVRYIDVRISIIVQAEPVLVRVRVR